MASSSRSGSELSLLGAVNLSKPSNSSRSRLRRAKAAQKIRMSQTISEAADAAALSPPPGLEAPPGLPLPDVSTPPPGLAPPPVIACCKGESWCKKDVSASSNYVESCSTSTTHWSSSDHEQTESEAEGFQMKPSSLCFVHGFLNNTIQMEPGAEGVRMQAGVSCSVPSFLSNIIRLGTSCKKQKSPLATTLLGFPLPHEATRRAPPVGPTTMAKVNVQEELFANQVQQTRRCGRSVSQQWLLNQKLFTLAAARQAAAAAAARHMPYLVHPTQRK